MFKLSKQVKTEQRQKDRHSDNDRDRDRDRKTKTETEIEKKKGEKAEKPGPTHFSILKTHERFFVSIVKKE